MKKLENYLNAVNRLGEAVTEYLKQKDNTLYQDAVIQRFEFTFELAWKSLKEYMVDQGLNLNDNLPFPKQVLKEAYAHNLIEDEGVWSNMLVSRNMTSHVYDESTAAAIAETISSQYLGALLRLRERYNQLQ